MWRVKKKKEAKEKNSEVMSTGATGTVNVGTGSANINIGTNANTTVNIGSSIRGGPINIGTGGTGGISIGNSNCLVNSYNLLLDGTTLRAPRLLLKNTKVLTIVSGNSNNLLETFTSPTGNNFDLIIIIINGDINVQNNMTVSAAVNSTQIFASVANGIAGSARFSYSIFAP